METGQEMLLEKFNIMPLLYTYKVVLVVLYLEVVVVQTDGELRVMDT